MDFWDTLASHGDQLALIKHDFSISYTELAVKVDAFCLEIEAGLPPDVTRPLILLEAVNEPGAIIAYLGALRAHWPVILVAEGSAGRESQIVQTYRPNIIFRRAADWKPVFAFTDPIEMHPDLAVLLSTSGTTGASKLVRLSRQNLATNAAAIADYLHISCDDRAITLLPFHYSYGMSVLHTHLLRGAGLVLTEGSLIDADLRALATRMQVNSLALVPTQFELLSDLAWLPRLRYITQAGGRLDPVLARQFSDKAAREGWQLFIMYGQTEAGPRMSYVPPEDAQAWFHTIGRPLEGGGFRLLDSTGQEVQATNTTGELVYEGPNVMLGYAVTRADLGAPAGPCVLHTGDLAERLENGYFRITGRASRFIKIFGLRISLDEVETQLRAEGNRVYVTGSDAQLAVFVQDATNLGQLQDHISALYHLPQNVILVSSIKAAPLLPSGKVDYRTLARQADALQPGAQETGLDTRTALQRALRMPVLDLDRSFVDLGGDSLAYLDLQLHLLTKLGVAPPDWETLPLRTLLAQEKPVRPASAGGRFSVQRVRADLLARVIAILSVVALHSTPWSTGGGSYLLLMMVGYSLARFQSHTLFEGNVLRTWRSMLVPILACYYLLISLISLLWHPVSVPWFVLLGNFEQVISLKGLVPYWFVSTYTQIVLLFTLPFLLPSCRHQVVRYPFAIGLFILACVVLAIRFSPVADIAPPIRHRHPLAAIELLLLGWCIFFTRDRAQKALMTLVTLLVWWISWRDAPHSVNYMIVCGALAIIWRLSIDIPTPLARGLMHIGSVTLFLYIVHVPVISLVTSLGLRSDALRFCVVTALSVLAAGAFKALYDWTDGRLSSQWPARS
ncbi:AMP-binding protein [Phaeovulum sp.]|uniref:AMP-binding protein n=1 Tax=Phaeovulum sp. TaxID=2934796 RepID=UPI0039E4136E